MTQRNACWTRLMAEIQANLCLLVILGVAPAVLIACGPIHFNPGRDVAPSADPARVWIPPVSVARARETTSSLEELRALNLVPAQPSPAGNEYDLPTLVDVALRSNPQTRRTWYQARAAEAQYGRSNSNDYPKVAAEAEGGYLKLPIQFPGETLVIRNEAFLPQIKVSYDLLDFGRSRAAERGAREQLIGANFAFNRAIQDVVFNVEKAYYFLSAAHASVSAAQANLRLAGTSLAAVQERHEMGLATQPQILMAKQVEAKAVYDLENAKSMVHDAEAGLRQAIGVAADTDIRIKRSQLDVLPKNLGNDVTTLMADALKQRPDIAAQIASV